MTLRLRLTLLYGGCFLIAGAALLTITYVLFAHGTVTPRAYVRAQAFRAAALPGGPNESLKFRPGGALTIDVQGRQVNAKPTPELIDKLRKSGQAQLNGLARKANVALSVQRAQSLDALLAESGIALAIMALLSVLLGWLVAGRALRPLRTMNQRARSITEDTLHERLGLTGRNDELGELAATFDAVLARLERAFESQRRFVANASHELRTPVTLERALLEVALADPDASVQSLRRTCERVLAAGEQQERVIDALLTLARGQAGLDRAELVDLAEMAGALLQARRAQTDGIHLQTQLDPAPISGDPALLERMVANLLDNAIVHNDASWPWIRVQTRTADGRARLSISNGGLAIAPDRVAEMFEPFRRLEEERTGGEGLGLGLSIVRAIVLAHGGEVEARAPAEGGLELSVHFAAAPPTGLGRQAPSLDSVLDDSTDEVLAGPDRPRR